MPSDVQKTTKIIFTAAEWNGRWWLDRVNGDCFTAAAVGPFPDELSALRRANAMNRVNEGLEVQEDV